MQYETDETLKSFGKRLTRLRESKNISINMLAYENDLPKSSISKIERGIIDFRFSTLLKIANALEIPLSELLDI